MDARKLVAEQLDDWAGDLKAIGGLVKAKEDAGAIVGLRIFTAKVAGAADRIAEVLAKAREEGA